MRIVSLFGLIMELEPIRLSNNFAGLLMSIYIATISVAMTMMPGNQTRGKITNTVLSLHSRFVYGPEWAWQQSTRTWVSYLEIWVSIKKH